MPKITRKLTEAEFQNAQPKAKSYKLYDPDGVKNTAIRYRVRGGVVIEKEVCRSY